MKFPGLTPPLLPVPGAPRGLEEPPPKDPSGAEVPVPQLGTVIWPPSTSPPSSLIRDISELSIPGDLLGGGALARMSDESVRGLDGFDTGFESSESPEVSKLDWITLSKLTCQMGFFEPAEMKIVKVFRP